MSHPDDRSTLPVWAKRLALSERSLARLMRRETGLTFGRWRQQLHLIIALQELASGVSVQNVAAKLGYESVNAFITLFKKRWGRRRRTILPNGRPALVKKRDGRRPLA